MPLYSTNELMFELPPELKDKTHHIFALSDDGPSAFNVVISRTPVDPSETLESYENRLVPELRQSLPKFQLLRRELIEVAGQPALELEYRWSNQGTMLQQTQVSFFYEPEPARRLVLQIAATFTSGTATEKNWPEKFRTMLSTFRLRQGDRPAF